MPVPPKIRVWEEFEVEDYESKPVFWILCLIRCETGWNKNLRANYIENWSIYCVITSAISTFQEIIKPWLIQLYVQILLLFKVNNNDERKATFFFFGKPRIYILKNLRKVVKHTTRYTLDSKLLASRPEQIPHPTRFLGPSEKAECWHTVY